MKQVADKGGGSDVEIERVRRTNTADEMRETNLCRKTGFLRISAMRRSDFADDDEEAPAGGSTVK